MLLRRITDFILKGRLNALAAAFLCSYIPLLTGSVFVELFIGTLGIIIAAFVTLRKGSVEGAFVTIAATLPYLLGFAVKHSGNEVWIFGIFVAVGSNLLTWLLAVLLRKYGNWSLTLDISLVVGVAGVVLAHLLYPDIQDWWAKQIANYFTNMQTQMNQELSPEALASLVSSFKPYVTGFIAIGILFSALVPVLLARAWQAAMFNPGGLREELYRIRLSAITAFIFVVALVLSYFGYATALDIMPILYGIYCVAGLSVVHVLLGATELWWLWLGMVYMALIFIPFFPIILAFIALLDTSVDFRKKRFSK